MKRSTTPLQAIPDWFEEACSWRTGSKLKRRRYVILGLGPTETRVRILLDGNMRPMTLQVCRLVGEQYSLLYGKSISQADFDSPGIATKPTGADSAPTTSSTALDARFSHL
ncbi:hypothetical protein ACVWZM_004598 [Bradyrhizobium sp. USDA 4501]